ncbi:putative creatinine amidohydrolase [Actinoplanes missouriensis 431]|uniref:Putative creatinine amidohydrolase n=1 Tax=Actinoplanes missouriensis (strain ATCC 14538 / DSM 43046 / CBS 188.64 / JCM 3121 / NBRC 102363 / NCIMB 12654 / NRRL B-3342 / UNCC 431) TaxID=512565 RepID=I0H4K3_ACTM4|nr:mycofactocin biosynthesis peptidyl-dipeptidase MftE [Actinoplanes missouriensis]BAL87940.1 putative creatinine amidohydrolase [Actinoplanes missouriensis 431]
MIISLDRATWPDVPTSAGFVLVPVGSTEQHGPHLPLTTDTAIATAVSDMVARQLPERTVVAPPIAYGNSGEHAGFPGTMSIGYEALRTVIIETVRSLALWARRIVLINGHGGNARALDDAVAQMRAEGHDVAWTGCAFPGGDAHAGRSETSAMLYLAPAHVRMSLAAAGDTRPIEQLMPLLMEDGVRAVSPNGVLGDPAGANAYEGMILIEAVVNTTLRRIRVFSPDHRGRLTYPANRKDREAQRS